MTKRYQKSLCLFKGICIADLLWGSPSCRCKWPRQSPGSPQQRSFAPALLAWPEHWNEVETRNRSSPCSNVLHIIGLTKSLPVLNQSSVRFAGYVQLHRKAKPKSCMQSQAEKKDPNRFKVTKLEFWEPNHVLGSIHVTLPSWAALWSKDLTPELSNMFINHCNQTPLTKTKNLPFGTLLIAQQQV